MHESAPAEPSAPPIWLRCFIAAVGCAITLFGALVLVGWHLHWVALIQLHPGYPPMQYNTALCFILAGLALIVWTSPGTAGTTPFFGGLLLLLGGLTLSEYVFHANLGIDQFFFHAYITTETTSPGRMSPVSACCFALVALALISLELPLLGRWRPLFIGSLASLVISITVMAILGYAIGLPGTYGWGQLTRIALHTASCLGMAGVALFVIAWHLGLRPGERSPKWLPVPIALGVLTGTLILFLALKARQDEDSAQQVRTAAENARDEIEGRMEARIRSFVRMARRWEFSGVPSQPAWEYDAASYVHDFPDVQAVEWIDSSNLVRWVVPLAGNEGKINHDLLTEPNRRAAAVQAEREERPVVTHIVTLFHGGLGFVLYVPIVIRGQPDGLMAAVFDGQPCLDRYLPETVAPGEAIRISDHGAVFYQRDASNPPTRNVWEDDEKVNVAGVAWDMHVWATPVLARRLYSPLPAMVLWAGLAGALLLGTVCVLAARASLQASEARRANALLQTALDNVKTLEGMLPICAMCKRVRDDSGYWSQIETYIHDHTNASLSHGYCPECAAKVFQDFGYEVPESVQAAVDEGKFEKATALVGRKQE
jgi:sensor domain CHASE-containing protein